MPYRAILLRSIVDREARLPELLDERDVRDAGDAVEHALDLAAARLEHGEIRAEELHVERALESRLRLVHRVLGRLRVVEVDAGKGAELLIDRRR